MRTFILFLLTAITVSLLAACSGGGSPAVTQENGLDGQLLEGVTKVTSNTGDGLSGVEVELISRSNGQVTATTITTADGRFSFRQLPNGSFLLKVRFRSSADLDADGLLDEIVSYIPVDVLEDVVSLITAALDFEDDDNDSDFDSLKIDIRIKRGEGGSEDHFIRVHRHRHGDTKVDDDGDGDFDDEFEDDDNNGLPDGTNGGGNYPRGPKLRGEIEAISDASITVDGQTFEVTDATSFRIRGDRNADASEFEVGDEVQVTSFTDDNGVKVALEVKLKKNNGQGGDDNDDDDEQELTGEIEALTETSITLVGETFTITEDTLFLFQDKSDAEFGDFAVGDTVEVKARLVGDDWIVFRVRMEEEGIEPVLQDFAISFTDFGAHLGHTLYLKVKDAVSGETIGSITPLVVASGAFSSSIDGILESGKSYNIDFWADFDADGQLDATPIGTPIGVDHAWRLTSTADADGIALDFVHDTNFTDIRPF